MAGVLAMLALEYCATYCSVNSSAETHSRNLLPTAHHNHAAAAAPAAVPAAAPESPVHAHEPAESCNKLCKTSGGNTAAEGAGAHHAAAGDHVHVKMDSHGHHVHGHGEPHAVDMVPSLAHSHGCRQQPACHSTAVKQHVVCVTMELGCVFHSVVLGLALGVMSNAPNMVATLFIVLAIHQAVEGLALGSVLAATQRLSQHKKYVLAVVYALTLPAGIAGGVLASESYDPTSPIAVLVQGVANGVSGGMLLYVSLFSLLAAELSQHDLLHRPLLAVGLMVSVLFGAAIMCIIGLWA